MSYTTLFWFGFIVGVLAYIILSAIVKHIRTTTGVLKIDKTNPEKDLYRIELDDLDVIEKKKCVELAVSIVNSIPQK